MFDNSSRDRGSIPARVIPKTQNSYLKLPCLTLSIIKYGSRVKWSNPGKGVVPSLHFGIVASEKGACVCVCVYLPNVLPEQDVTQIQFLSGI